MTDPALNTLTDRSLGDRAKDAATATLEAAKEHPYATAGIAAGVAAAVGGVAYAATRLGDAMPAPRRRPARK